MSVDADTFSEFIAASNDSPSPLVEEKHFGRDPQIRFSSVIAWGIM